MDSNYAAKAEKAAARRSSTHVYRPNWQLPPISEERGQACVRGLTKMRPSTVTSPRSTESFTRRRPASESRGSS